MAGPLRRVARAGPRNQVCCMVQKLRPGAAPSGALGSSCACHRPPLPPPPPLRTPLRPHPRLRPSPLHLLRHRLRATQQCRHTCWVRSPTTVRRHKLRPPTAHFGVEYHWRGGGFEFGDGCKLCCVAGYSTRVKCSYRRCRRWRR